MAETCPDCGEPSFIHSYEENAAGKVCTECGYLEALQCQGLTHTDEGSYQKPAKQSMRYEYKGIKYYPEESREADGLRRGRDYVKILCKTLIFSEEMMSASVQAYERLYSHEKFKNMFITKKCTLGAVCVFIIARQFDYVLTIKDFCKIVREDNIRDFLLKYKEALKILDIQLPHQTMMAILDHHALKANLDPSVTSIAKQIVRTCQQVSTNLCASRDGIASVCLYFAWLSTQPHSEIKKQKYKKFCTEHNVQFKTHWKTHLPTIEKILSDMSLKLPWAPRTPPKFYAIINLQDILKYQNSLLCEHLLSATDHDENSEEIPSVNYLKMGCICKEGDSVDKENDTGTKRPSEGNEREREFKKLKKYPCDNCSGYRVNQNVPDSDEEWENAALDVDQHLNRYLRTPEEVKHLEEYAN